MSQSPTTPPPKKAERQNKRPLKINGSFLFLSFFFIFFLLFKTNH